MRTMKNEIDKTKEILKSIIGVLDESKKQVIKSQNVNNGQLLGTLCDVLSDRLQEDFSSTTQNLHRIINIH